MSISRLTGPQVYRMQQLLEWLGTDRPLNARIAAERFEVSSRTIASDIGYLRQIGVPLEYDRRRNTYFLIEPFENLPLLALRRADFAAFLVAQHALDAIGDQPHAALLEAVAARLAEVLPETVRVEPETLTRHLRIDPGPQPTRPAPHLATLQQAAADHRAVRLRYYAPSRDEVTERVVEPHLVLRHQSRWYVVAYCRLREALRDFRLDRIRHLEPLDDYFALRPSFSPEDYLADAFGMHRGDRTYAVHVRFSARQARWIREEQWHPTQLLTERPDGTLDVRLQATGLGDLARWVLSYGGEAEVLSPPVLRRRVAAEARRLAEIYQHEPPIHQAE